MRLVIDIDGFFWFNLKPSIRQLETKGIVINIFKKPKTQFIIYTIKCFYYFLRQFTMFIIFHIFY